MTLLETAQLLGSFGYVPHDAKPGCPYLISDRIEFLDFSPPELKHRRHAQLDTRTAWIGSRVLEVAPFQNRNSQVREDSRDQFGRGVW